MALESHMRESMPESDVAKSEGVFRDIGDAALHSDTETMPGAQQDRAMGEDTPGTLQYTPDPTAPNVPPLGEKTETSPRDFTTIITQHEALVVNVLTQMLSNREDARDAAQDTWLGAWRAWSKDPAKINDMHSWLMSIATRTAIDYIRHRRTVRELPFDINIGDDVITFEPAADTDIEDEVISRMMVAQALRHMPSSLRRAIILDMKHVELPEIAAALHLKETGMAMHMSRARRSFKAQIAAIAEEAEARQSA